jgi:phosphoglycolate phosphatase-like HAD superfamily hydrolase
MTLSASASSSACLCNYIGVPPVLLLFDIDGTLLLTGGAGARALNRAFEDLFDVADAMATVKPAGKTDPFIITEAFRAGLGRDPRPTEIKAVQDRYGRYIDEEVDASPNFRLMPHVHSIITTLRGEARYMLGIATGNSAVGARAKLRRAGLADAFSVGGYGSDSDHRPSLVKTAIERANAERASSFSDDDVFVIGDTPYDIAAARACGVVAVAVATGSYQASELVDADHVLTTLAELPAILSGR